MRPRVYCAHPLISYGTDHERACLAAVARLLPSAEIIDPATRYRTNRAWLLDWPQLVPTLSAVVVFTEPETGTVGCGVLREVVDALYAGLPVAVLDSEHRLCELAGFTLLSAGERSAACAAWPVVGEPFNLGAVLSKGQKGEGVSTRKVASRVA